MIQDPEDKPKPKLPSKRQMMFNLTEGIKDTLKKMVTEGVVLAPQDVIQKRQDICWDCEHFIEQPEGAVLPYRCGVCGCGMRVKTQLAASKCPLAKWGSV